MSKLKTAYELSQERIINSRYKRVEPAEDDWEQNLIPDYRYPGAESFVPVNMNDNEDIESDITLPTPEPVPEFLPSIQLQEPETITYEDSVMETHWYGDFLSYTGFARMNRSMVFGLSERMVRVNIEMLDPNGTTVNQATRDHLEFLSKNRISPTAPKIYGATLPLSFMHAGPKILYTMIETSGSVHPQYLDRLSLFDEIWVPTQYGKSILERSGIRTPVKVMPLGVDTERYVPKKTSQFEFGSDLNQFVFLSVFRWSYRKGFDILLRAFMEEFSSEDDVSLILVSRWLDCNESNSAEKIQKDFYQLRQYIDKSDDQLPHISLYTNPVHEANMPIVYNSADAFVLISRGEGFGLPLIEAGSCGIPVIASKCSGHSDFINDNTAFTIEPEKYVKVSSSGEMAEMAKLCHFYEGQEFPYFGRKSIDELRTHMRNIYEDYTITQKKRINFQKIIQERYSWSHALDRVHDRIKTIVR